MILKGGGWEFFMMNMEQEDRVREGMTVVMLKWNMTQQVRVAGSLCNPASSKHCFKRSL